MVTAAQGVAGGHVGADEVEQAVVVEIAEVAAHGEPRGVGEGCARGVGEGAVAIVAVEAVGAVEVVGDVDVGPAVVVVIPPGNAEAFVVAVDPTSSVTSANLPAPSLR